MNLWTFRYQSHKCSTFFFSVIVTVKVKIHQQWLKIPTANPTIQIHALSFLFRCLYFKSEFSVPPSQLLLNVSRKKTLSLLLTLADFICICIYMYVSTLKCFTHRTAQVFNGFKQNLVGMSRLWVWFWTLLTWGNSCRYTHLNSFS